MVRGIPLYVAVVGQYHRVSARVPSCALEQVVVRGIK